MSYTSLLRLGTRSTHRKLLQGWMTQFPTRLCLIFSLISAFLLPKSFMASLLSEGWKKLRICSFSLSVLRRPVLPWLEMADPVSPPPFRTGSGSSSLGVPYRLVSSPRNWTLGSLACNKCVKMIHFGIFISNIFLKKLTDVINHREKNLFR